MAGVRLLHSVHTEGADGVDGQDVERTSTDGAARGGQQAIGRWG
jgi:hypothetical protein